MEKRTQDRLKQYASALAADQQTQQITERTASLLLDADNRVIASADPLWVAVGARVPVNQHGASPLLLHGGRTYLTQTVVAQGYQDYPGPPGWRGQVMVAHSTTGCCRAAP